MRAARARCGFTLEHLAERTGLSKAYLSRLESGERQPSVATLLTMSRVLGVPMSVLLGEAAPTAALAIYPDDAPANSVNGLTVAPLSGFAGSSALDAVRIILDPDRVPPPFACHSGEEWVHVVSGLLRLEYDGPSHLVHPGESAHFNAERPHRLGACGGATQVLLVAGQTTNDFRRAHQYTGP